MRLVLPYAVACRRSAAVLAASLALSACDSGLSFNLFSAEDDVELGQQIHDQILDNPEDYPLLDEAAYPDAYDFIYDIRDEILASGEVGYAAEFP